MCTMHYQRWYKHGDPLYVRPLVVGVAPCSIPGCEKVVAARGWCTAHWTRWKRHGSPTVRLPGEVVDGKRVCPECRQDKPLAELGRVYCRECYNARARRRPPKRVARHEAVCEECGAQFVGDRRQRKTCSTACSLLHARRLDRERVRDREVANAASRRWYAENRERSYEAKAAYRARKSAAHVESVNRTVVFDRDGWTCGICSASIDPLLACPDLMSASLDHVIPLARGGDHSYANVQAAHLGCNFAKGARVTVGGRS
jgi:5-methylcytosine-specific restriction endonuclease McrA